MNKKYGTWSIKVAKDWTYIVPPARPSLSELIVFDRYMSLFPAKSKLLILGSTAELRDLAYLHKFDTTVMDYNKINFKLIRNYMKHPDIAKLKLGDWKKMNLKDQFDIIVGDLATTMIPVDKEPIMLRNIAKHLKRNGLFVHRTWIYKSGVYDDFKDIVKEHNQKRKNLDYFYSTAMAMIIHCYNKEKKHTYFQDILTTLKKWKKKGLVSKEWFEAFDKSWHDYHLPNNLPTKKEFEKMVKRYFKIKEIKYGTDHFAEYCPIYVLSGK